MAEVVSLSNLANLQNETTAVGNINSNNATITTAFTDVVSRSGVSPNTMLANFDMNSNRIVNLAAPVGANDAARKADVDASGSASATAQAVIATTQAGIATTQAGNAAASAVSAAASAGASQANAIADVYTFDNTTNTGTTPATGALKFNAAIGSVTTIAINNLTAAAGNPDIHLYIDTWNNGGYLEIRKVGSTQNFLIFTVTSTTSQSGFRQVAGTVTATGGSFSLGDNLAVVFVRTGAAGAPGSGVTNGGPNLIALYTASATIAAGITGASSGLALLQSSGAVPTWSASPSWTNITATGTMSASTYNGLAVSPSSGATLTITGGKTASFTNTIAFSSIADGVSLNVGSGGTITTTSSTGIIYDNIPQNSRSAAYTTVLADAEKHILHPFSDNSSRTFTIDSNANVAYPIGTAITFINAGGNSAGGNTNTLTIAITTDVLRFAGNASGVGSRSLGVGGIATAIKTGTTEWHISGTGLT